MYIWVILATFFVAIMAKTITVRDDHNNVTLVPKAEGVTINLKIKQNAAMVYALSKTNPASVDYDQGCIDTAGCADGSVCCIAPSNVISTSDLPLGFQKDRFGFKSYIFCIDSANTSNTTVPCDVSTYNYVITHGKVPANWQDPVTKIPRYEFVKSIQNVTKSNNAGIIKELTNPTAAGESTVTGTKFVVETYRGHISTKAEGGGTYIVGIPRVAIDESCGGFAGGPGIACPGDVIYIQNINQPPLGIANPLPAPP